MIRLLELLARQRAEVRRQELGDQGARRGEDKIEMQEQGRRRSERELEGRSSNTSSESCSTRSRGRALGTVGSRGDRARSQERQVEPCREIQVRSPKRGSDIKIRKYSPKVISRHQQEEEEGGNEGGAASREERRLATRVSSLRLTLPILPPSQASINIHSSALAVTLATKNPV